MKNVFAMMLDELLSSYPETIKVPSREGGYIRVPVSVNAEWYRWFCRKYKGTRRRYPKPRTIIRRQTTIIALLRLIAGDYRGVYAERLLAFVRDFYAAECA